MVKTKKSDKTLLKTGKKTHTKAKKLNNILKRYQNRDQKDRLYRDRNNIKGDPN